MQSVVLITPPPPTTPSPILHLHSDGSRGAHVFKRRAPTIYLPKYTPSTCEKEMLVCRGRSCVGGAIYRITGLLHVLDLTIAALGMDGYRTVPNLNGAVSRKLLRQFVRARNVASEHTAFYSYCGLLVHQGYNSGTYNYRMQQKSRRLQAQLCILKMKIIKYPSRVLLHCTFTMYSPRMYSISQW